MNFDAVNSYEIPMSEFVSAFTVADLRRLTNESVDQFLASLEMWPDDPDLENGVTPWRESGWVNAVGLFAWGIAHDASHIRQIRKIMNTIRVE